jgi:hypothetical protein
LRIRDKFLKIIPLPNLKGKKARHVECMLEPSHWLHEISLPKRVHHHIWPGVPLAKNTLPIGPLSKQDHILILGGEGRGGSRGGKYWQENSWISKS